MVAKFGTNADCITCWPNFQPMQVTFSFAGELTQVLDAIPWVRCASGNVSFQDNLRCFGVNYDMSQITRLLCYFLTLRHASVISYCAFPSLLGGLCWVAGSG